MAPRSDSLAWVDSPANVRVLPFEWASRFRVSTDVAHEFSREIFDRGKDSASDDLTLQSGEPNLNLIEPGRNGRCEMKLHTGLLFQELSDLAGFVRGQVVQDDVDFLVWVTTGDHLFEKTDELRTGMSLSGLALHLSCPNIQRRVERLIQYFSNCDFIPA